MILGRAASVLGLAMLATTAATPRAQADASCEQGRERDAFRTGHAQGEQLVESAFRQVGSACAELSQVARTVRASLERAAVPEDASAFIQCRFDGVVAGANDKLASIAAECGH